MYDVLIGGYGPTGMMAAILLGRAGKRVAVIERYKTLYNLPRVGIVHDDVLRMFQEIGIAERILPATYFLPTYELSHHDEVLLSNRVAEMETHGWPEMTSIYQPAFEAELDILAKSLETIDVFQGWTMTAVAQDETSVTVTATDDTGAERAFGGRYLVAADGGNSFVRAALGIEYENLGFDQAWLVIDGKQKRGRGGRPELRQFCEPEQPGMTMQMGPDHRRWSFMIFDGERPEDAVKPDSVWRRLNRPEGGTEDDFGLVRVAHYQFRSLIAERWRQGRVFLAGDAAHQMPPFLAQGMCSGFRDSHNIAWKLALVLDGLAADALLDSYEAERGPNARATIVESMRVGQNVNERDPEKVRQRNNFLRAMQAANEGAMSEKKLIAFRVPGLETGLLTGPHGGKACGQGFVSGPDGEGRFDDIVGTGFAIIARGEAPDSVLPEPGLAFWAKLNGKFARFGDADGALKDVSSYFSGLMDDLGCDVLVRRPDNYLFGAAEKIDDLPTLIAELERQLRSA
ncbi:MAG: bifunctional 3-(3-hydroxy-phenyl)propionate/3-hydroxycinnamic acid hydroxylase [Alphaproteobacteria bacterium]